MSLITKDTNRRWRNAVIPFSFDSKAAADITITGNVSTAIAAWQAVTPVQFVPQTMETDFIRFTKDINAPRCSSPVGRQGGRQELPCNSGFTVNAYVHEIGHAIGLQHEHQRFDRDAFVGVSEAAKNDRPQDFVHLQDELMVGPYDYGSVMHYPWSVTDTSQPLSKKVPGAPPPNWMPLTNPSPGDAEGVCFMYGIVPDRTPIAALGRDGDHMELWVVAGDGTVRGAWFDGIWRHWYQLIGPTFPQRGHLAVISHKQGHYAVFGIGNDGQLYHTWFDEGWRKTWWNLQAPPIPVPTGTMALTPGAPLAACSRKEGHMEVWVVGNDKNVWGIWWNGSDWQNWFKLGGTDFPIGAPIGVHSRHEDHMELFCIDENGILRNNWWFADKTWEPVWGARPTPTGTPDSFRLVSKGHLAVIGRHEDHMEVFSIGSDRKLHGIWWNGDDWQNWHTLEGRFFPKGAPLVALSRNKKHMEVYSVTDVSGPSFLADRLQAIHFESGWKTWLEIDQTVAVGANTPLAALSRNENHLQVWAAAPGGGLVKDCGVQGVWYDGSNWRSFFRVV